MSSNEKINLVFAFPLAFVLGVLAIALLQLFQVGGAAMAFILGGGFLLLFLVNHHLGRVGNLAILRFFARYADDPEETRERIDAEHAKKSVKTPSLTRVLQITGFAAGILACLVWSPSEVLGLIGKLSLI